MQNGEKEIFQIDTTTIQMADEFKGGFVNPRHFHQGHNGVVAAQGLDNESMHQLCSDIEENGIRNPLFVRKINVDGQDILQLIYGERRLRCALKLGMKTVPCYVAENMSDEEAWKTAWRENDNAKGIGENATAALVKHWREMGFSDAKILEITNRTGQWLRQMDVLGNLDAESFDAHAKGFLSLRVALQLAMIEDVELRHKVLAETLADAERDHKDLIVKQKKTIEKAEEKVETAQATLAVAEMMGSANVEDAKQEVEKAEGELQHLNHELAEQQEAIPQAKNKNLNRASRKVGADQTASSLTKAKLQKLLAKIDKYLENEGCDGDDFVGEIPHLQLVRNVLDAILTGDDNFKALFADFYDWVNTLEDKASQQDDEEEYEEEEEEYEDEDEDEDEDDGNDYESDEYNEDEDEETDNERIYDELRKSGFRDEDD